jgi:sugar phosphate isomerase/epimerase
VEFVSPSIDFEDDPLPTALGRMARDGGAPLVEVWAGNPAHFRPWDAHDVAAAMRALDAHDMRAFSLHAPFTGPEDDLSALEEARRRRAVERHRQCVESAAALGAPILVIHPGVALPEAPDLAALVACSIASIRELAVLSEAKGVRLAVESLPPSYLGGRVEELVAIVDGASSEAVGICMDTGHCNLSGNVVEWIRALGSRIISIHLHDNDGSDDQHLPPGEGSINWLAFASALREIGYSQPITLEVALREGWTLAAVKQRAAALLTGAEASHGAGETR